MSLLGIAVIAGLFFTISAFILGRISVTRKIKKHIPNLNESTAQLMGSSEQIGLVSNDLAAASQEQLNVLTTTISTSVEIRSMIEKTNESTSFLKNESENLKNSVHSGNKIVQDMVSSSQDIQRESEKFSTEMQKSIDQLTGALSVIKEIATKTELINQIVFQTKILSFNASIEAARAGEAGKGFSVVAEEVGNLAQMSGNASDEIYKIVEKSINVVQETINTTKDRISLLTRETTEKSQAGYSHAKECEKIFNEVSEKITETTLLIGQISAATSEQTLGVTQLDRSINELKEVADRNRLVASQTTEYVSDLETQTSNLNQTIQDLKKLDRKLSEQKVTLQKFIWNAKLELGIDQMDDEHIILVEKINILVTELENQYVQKNKDKLLRAFQDLASYTAEHFDHEEKFMQSIKYPQFSSHQKIHKKLLAQVGKYGDDIRYDKLDDQKLVSFLKGWLISHIMGVDKQYAAHHHSGSHRKAS